MEFDQLFPDFPTLQFNPVKSKTKMTIATGSITFKDLELFLHLLNTKLY